MQGKQDYQPELISTVNIESLVPQNHLLRKIDKTLDLSFIRKETEDLYCLNNGRPSIDPELFIRMMLIMTLYGIRSERQLCEEIQYNLAYRWFCKLNLSESTPSHSSMSRTRDRLGEKTFSTLFEKVVEMAKAKGLVRGDKFIGDGTIIEADASLYSFVEKGKENDPEELKKAQNILGRKITNQTHVSRVDPDAKLAGIGRSKKGLKYKIHNIIDSKERIIIDSHVTSGAETEGKTFIKRVEVTEERFGLKAKELVADRGYGYGENLKYFHDKGIHTSIPNFHRGAGGRIDEEKFKYDVNKDIYICSKGHELHCFQENPSKEMKRYTLQGGHCRNCDLQSQCLGKNKRLQKRLNVSIYKMYQDKVRFQEKTDEFKKTMHERKWKIEGLFAEAKQFHGQRRAKYRGRSKVQIQAYMIATVQNLKRMISSFIFELKFFFQNMNLKVQKY